MAASGVAMTKGKIQLWDAGGRPSPQDGAWVGVLVVTGGLLKQHLRSHLDQWLWTLYRSSPAGMPRVQVSLTDLRSFLAGQERHRLGTVMNCEDKGDLHQRLSEQRHKCLHWQHIACQSGWNYSLASVLPSSGAGTSMRRGKNTRKEVKPAWAEALSASASAAWSQTLLW